MHILKLEIVPKASVVDQIASYTKYWNIHKK